jgi:hypothetical protein
MSTYKRNFNEKFDPQYEEKNYQTLDELDLSDIAQAIDGGRSRSLKKAPIEKLLDKDSNNGLKAKKFWFW